MTVEFCRQAQPEFRVRWKRKKVCGTLAMPSSNNAETHVFLQPCCHGLFVLMYDDPCRRLRGCLMVLQFCDRLLPDGRLDLEFKLLKILKFCSPTLNLFLSNIVSCSVYISYKPFLYFCNSLFIYLNCFFIYEERCISFVNISSFIPSRYP